MLRDFLIASGVAPKDISDAVKQSRGVVRGISRWSSLVAQGASHVGEKAKTGSRTQKGAFIVVMVASTIASKTDELLGRKRK
jgi:hypothetical protein